jgi:hypothetical protein
MMANSNIAVAREMVPDNVQEAVIELESMNVPALRTRYREVFKEDSRSHNGPYLRKRIGYRLQEIAYGGLSERAKARIRELVVDAPIRRRGFPVPKEVLVGRQLASEPLAPGGEALANRDPRLPPTGTTLRRQYGKSVHVVAVEDDGFVFRGQRHESLSKVARLITGTSWNGFTFFGLTKPWEAR